MTCDLLQEGLQCRGWQGFCRLRLLVASKLLPKRGWVPHCRSNNLQDTAGTSSGSMPVRLSRPVPLFR